MPRRIATTIGLCLLVALAANALAASAASAAPGWKVNGKRLLAGESKKLKEAVNVKKAFVLTGAGVEIKCEKLKNTGGNIKGSAVGTAGTGEASSLVFTECTVANSAVKCEVEGKKVTTVAVKAELLEGVKVKFEPKAGTEFVNIKVVNKGAEECGLAGNYKVTGQATCNAPKASSELIEQVLECTATSGSALKVAEKAATFVGEAGLELEPAEPWSTE